MVLSLTIPVVTLVPACSVVVAGISSSVSASSFFSWAERRARAACLASKSSSSTSRSASRALVALARLAANDSAVSSFQRRAASELALSAVALIYMGDGFFFWIVGRFFFGGCFGTVWRKYRVGLSTVLELNSEGSVVRFGTLPEVLC